MAPRERIAQAIAREGGWVSFARYMHLALHEPGLGYYTSGAHKFGAGGDFVTAPELGSLFGRCLARQLRGIPGGRILELGAGTGALAEVLARETGFEYFILETSAELRARQQARLGGRVRFLDAMPRAFRGAIVANEVADALPVHVVKWTEDAILERGVTAALDWEDRAAEGGLRAAASELPVAAFPYVSEVGLQARAWVRHILESLEEGAFFIVDYGFPRHEYYHPQRDRGTLMCHHQHRAHADPFARPGEEDITAHVDFTALAQAGEEAGARLLGYATQAQFLINCGITDVLAEANVENALRYAPIAAEAQKLLSPAEMGELFKVLALGRGVTEPLLGFRSGDRSHTL